ncbi:unnamed protein product [Aphanomyces euteiches]
MAAQTWPEVRWDAIDKDFELLKKNTTVNKEPEDLISRGNEEDEAEAKLHELARDIFQVHNYIDSSIRRVQCEAALVRVIQTFLLQQELQSDPNEQNRANEWLSSQVSEWCLTQNDDKGLLDCIRDDIHSAKSKEEFLQQLEAATHPTLSFPVATVLRDDSATHLLGNVPQISESEAFQDAKDIKRDQLCVNGVLYPGMIGYEALVKALAHDIKQVASEYRASYASFESTYEEMAKRILHSINRTESGGASYEILSDLVTPPPQSSPLVLLRPNSKQAQPLQIRIDMGAYEEATTGWCFGLRVALEAQTSYVVCDSDDPTTEWCTA